MIHTKEINAQARQYKIKDTQIEKDYVLSWILYAIFQNELLSRILVFKGATVLKKAYFGDYRFSEDLDFTLLNETISNELILKEFEGVYQFVIEEANISLQFKEKDIHSNGSIVFYINYMGPLQANIKLRDVKIDITRGEQMEFEIQHRPVLRDYSDQSKRIT